MVVIVGFVLFVELSSDKKFDAPYPDIRASKDPEVIARGKYIAYGPGHCSICHVPMNEIAAVEKGKIMPLIGGWEVSIPPGTFRAPNLTPDEETGIGKRSDQEIARVLRHMVGFEGQCVMPFMPFAELSDADLRAVISFLRSQPPVKHAVPKSEFTFLGKMGLAMGLIKPMGFLKTPPQTVRMDTTVEYGKYLANYVANCVGCHTERDLKTGNLVGTPFAGGMAFPPEALSEGHSFLSPNLTPHTGTGVMASWSEEQFLSRFRAGRTNGSPMPWGSFSRMDEMDIRAIYRYLKTLPAKEKYIEKTIWQPGETPPGLEG